MRSNPDEFGDLICARNRWFTAEDLAAEEEPHAITAIRSEVIDGHKLPGLDAEPEFFADLPDRGSPGRFSSLDHATWQAISTLAIPFAHQQDATVGIEKQRS